MKYEVLANGCWRCTSHCLSNQGYVKLTIKGKLISGHRHMYEQKYGKPNLEVLRHTCDNRWCVNPDHLIEGTHNDNVQDRVLRNRSARGVNNGRAKLTEQNVIDIYNDKITTNTFLSSKYGVDPKVIRDIKQKKTWKHITLLL